MKIHNTRFPILAILLIALLGFGLVQALAPNRLFSDHPFLENLKKKLSNYQEHHRSEKVYLHVDKTFM